MRRHEDGIIINIARSVVRRLMRQPRVRSTRAVMSCRSSGTSAGETTGALTAKVTHLPRGKIRQSSGNALLASTSDVRRSRPRREHATTRAPASAAACYH